MFFSKRHSLKEILKICGKNTSGGMSEGQEEMVSKDIAKYRYRWYKVNKVASNLGVGMIE